MDYCTQPLQLNLDIIESVLLNCEEEIPKLKVKINFDKKDAYERFLTKLNPIEDEENQVLKDQCSDDENQPVLERKKTEIEGKMYIQKLSNFEEAAILKQNYEGKIQKISRQTGCRILIVPEKIKYFADNFEIIEEAKDKIFQLKQKLNIHPIKKYGHEIYESNIFRTRLNEEKIYLTKIFDGYYFWYEEEETKTKSTNSIIQKIFNRITHQFYPLYPYHHTRLSAVHLENIVKIKGKIFKQHINKNINEGLDEMHQIQLSKSGRELIIHCEVSEQSQIYKKQLTQIYNNIIYFFVVYDEQDRDSEEEIKNIDEITSYLDTVNINWFLRDNMLVIAYEKRSIGVNESMMNQSKLNEGGNKQDFLMNLKPIFDKNLHCTIEVLFDDHYGVCLPFDEIEPQKKITIQDKKVHQLRVFSVKSRRSQRFIDIIDEFILKPKLQKKKKVNQISNESMSQANTSSKILDSSSHVFAHSAHVDNDLNNSVVEGNVLPQELKMPKNSKFLTGLFEKYSRKMEDNDQKKKYSSEVDELVKGKSELQSDDFRERLYELVNYKYKIYKVKIPEKLQVTLKEEDKIVTVFIKDSEKGNKNIYGPQPITVILLNKFTELKTNGWLANVPKASLSITEERRVQMKPGQYEVIKYVKYVSQ